LTGSVEDGKCGGVDVFHYAMLDVTCLCTCAPVEGFVGGFSLQRLS
jgi:hypothetical protein